jgi:hypothetical protein
MHDHVAIEKLVLRVSNMTRDEAARLARDVAEGLAERMLASGRTRRVDLARLQITIPDDVPAARLADAISDRIWEALR